MGDSIAVSHQRPGGGFSAAWILLTSLAVPVESITCFAIMRMIVDILGDFVYMNGVRHITEDDLFLYVIVPLVGLVQYGLLRPVLPRMGWWILATLGGWLLGVSAIILLLQLGWMGIPFQAERWLVLR